MSTTRPPSGRSLYGTDWTEQAIESLDVAEVMAEEVEDYGAKAILFALIGIGEALLAVTKELADR